MHSHLIVHLVGPVALYDALGAVHPQQPPVGGRACAPRHQRARVAHPIALCPAQCARAPLQHIPMRPVLS